MGDTPETKVNSEQKQGAVFGEVFVIVADWSKVE